MHLILEVWQYMDWLIWLIPLWLPIVLFSRDSVIYFDAFYVNFCLNTLSLRQDGHHFCRHFHMHFLEWKFCISNEISLKYVPWSLINNEPSFKNGLLLNRRQAIIWTNDGLDYWRMYASLSLNELTGHVTPAAITGTTVLRPYLY